MNISNIDIEIVKKDIKNLHIGVYPPNGRVRVATPLYMSDEAIRVAIINRLSWLKREIKNFKEQPRESKREMISGESHYFLGKRYLLDVIYDSKRHFVVLKHSKIELHIQKTTTSENRYKLLQEWYRKELYSTLSKLIDKWEKQIGQKINSWQIKRMKTKWGSCNIDKKSIIFNLYLARVPIGCIEYIVVHEMVHLLERNHNENFKFYMDRFLPDWQNHKELLGNFILNYEEW